MSRSIGSAGLLSLAMLLLPATDALARAGAMDYAELVRLQGPAVVHIAVRNAPKARGGPNPSDGFGTGFFVSGDGYLLTNAHVVADALTLRVRTVDGRDLPARRVGMDPVTDVALLKVEATGLPTVRPAPIDSVRVGEPVGAIGSPFGYEHSVTAGIVSAKSRNVDEQFVSFIQTDAAINPGNSGGPLFNARGEVIGINSRIFARAGGFAGVAFAIPIDVAMRVADELRSRGHVAYGHIDVATQRVTPELATVLGLSGTRGALVTDPGPASPGGSGRLRPSDVIVRVAGRDIEHPLDVPRAASALRPGTLATVEVLRDGRSEMLRVPVVALAGRTRPLVAKTAPDSTTVHGLAVRPLSPEEQARFSGVQGLMVERVAENSPAALADLQAGDVVLSVHGRHAAGLDSLGPALSARAPVALRVQRGGKRIFVALDPEASGL